MAAGTEKTKHTRRYARRISQREQKRQLRLSIFAIAIVLVLLAGGLVYKTNILWQEQKMYTQQIEKLEKEIADQEALQKELQKKKLEVTSDSYIEAEARSKLNMVFDGEILIKKKE